jgi:hypothetical protein
MPGYFDLRGQCHPDFATAMRASCTQMNHAEFGGYVRCTAPRGTTEPWFVASIGQYPRGVTGGDQDVYWQLQACDPSQAPNFPWNLSVSEGAQISAAILGVWALAWCLRALRRVLSSDGVPESE